MCERKTAIDRDVLDGAFLEVRELRLHDLKYHLDEHSVECIAYADSGDARGKHIVGRMMGFEALLLAALPDERNRGSRPTRHLDEAARGYARGLPSELVLKEGKKVYRRAFAADLRYSVKKVF